MVPFIFGYVGTSSFNTGISSFNTGISSSNTGISSSNTGIISLNVGLAYEMGRKNRHPEKIGENSKTKVN